jgi:type IV pilus assembly protein PilB
VVPVALGTKRIRLGELLIKAGVLTEEQLGQALARQKETNKQIGETLIDMGFVNEEKIKYALEVQFGVKHINLKTARIPPEVLKLLPEQLLKQYMMIPVAVNQLTVALVDPNNILAIDEIRQRLRGVNVVPAVCTEGDFWETLKTIPKDSAPSPGALGNNELKSASAANLTEVAVVSDARVRELIDAASKGSGETAVTNLVNALLASAVKRHASSILMEPMEHELLVRYRVDGTLHREGPIPAKIAQAVAQRLKVMGGITVGSGNTPQQGQIAFNFENRPIKMALNTLPARHGQVITIRIFDSAMLSQPSLDGLVLHPKVAAALRSLLAKPAGLIPFAGPVGAGKTVLLYACLKELHALGSSVITVENPIAADLDGITQVPVATDPGPNDLSVTAGIQAALGQSPKALMVTQISDEAIAQRLAKGALGGTAILAGLPTTQSVVVEARESWNLPPRLVANALGGTVTQRLVRRLCPNCKESYEPDEKTKAFFARLNGSGQLMRGKGCDECFKTGFSGMVGVYEVMPFTPPIRELVARNAPKGAMDQLLRQAGLLTLEDYALWLVAHGHTTWDEVKRTDIHDLAQSGQLAGAGAQAEGAGG